MTKKWLRHTMCALVLIGTIAACGSGEDDAAEGSATSATGSATSSATVTDDGRAAGVPAAPSCDASAGETSAAGVTDESVNVGAMYLDTSRLVDIGLDVDAGPVSEILTGLLEAPNATGGVCGRTINVTVASYDVLEAGSDARACSRLTEDSTQFVVLAISAVSIPALRCVADQGETLTVTDAVMAQSFPDEMEGRLFSLATDLDTSLPATPSIFDEAGVLEGKVGFIYGGSGDTRDLTDAMARHVTPGLEDVVTCELPAAASQPEGAAALPLCVEQFVSEGVNTIVSGVDIYSFVLFANEAEKQGLQPRYVNAGGFGCCDDVNDLFFHELSNPAYFDGLVSIVYDVQDHESAYARSCLDRIDRLGVEPAPSDMTSFQRGAAINYCFRADVVLYGLAAAGAAPTQQTFIAGLEEMPPFATPGGAYGSFGPDKHVFGDELRLWAYDATTDSFSPLSDRRFAIG